MMIKTQLRKMAVWLFDFFKEYFFRRKTLNYIIWVVIVAIISELKAIGNSELLNTLIDKIDSDFDGQFVEYSCVLLRFIFVEGSYEVLFVLILILLFLFYLKHKELKKKNWNEQDEVYKVELILRVTSLIRQLKEIDTKTFIELSRIIDDPDLQENLKFYYSFERRRGNITLLEQYVKDTNIIDNLTKLN